MYLLLYGFALTLGIAILWLLRLSRKIRQYQHIERRFRGLEQQYVHLKTRIRDFKRSEEALQRSEAHQRALLTAIPDLIMRVNRAGIYLEFTASPNFQVIGNLKGLVGIDITHGFPPDLAQIRREAIHVALDTQSMQIYEQNFTFDGRIQYEEVRVVPYSDDEVLLLVRDISDRQEGRQAERALRESEERYRSIYDQAAVGLVNTTFDAKRLVNVNPCFCEMLGYSQAELLTKTVMEITHPDDRGRVLPEVKKLINGDRPHFFQEKRYLRKDGSTFWSITGVSIVRDALGNPKHTLAVVQDITERKRLEAEGQQAADQLRQSEQRFRNMAANVPGAIFRYVLHPDGSDAVIYMSPGCCGLWEVEAEDVVHDASILWKMVHPDDLTDMMASVKFSAQTLDPWVYQWRITTSSGQSKWLEAAGRPERQDNGDVVWDTLILDVSDRVRAQAQLKHDALHDGLTGLPNRTLLMERLELALKRAKRHADVQFAVLFLDLDNFKVINDSLGHSVGDTLLLAVATQLKTFIRETDVAARLGGDEFVLLIEDIEVLTEAIAIAKRILAALQDPFVLDEREVFTSASIGILSWDGRQRSAEDCLRDADLAMYRAKQSGRSQYAIFNPNMHVQAMQRLQLENELRRGLDNQEFVLYYQPIVTLETGAIKGFEALIRWQHPERGLIFPGDFIAIAEDTRLIVPMGWWVLKTACAQMAIWQTQCPSQNLRISINLSAQQLHPELLEHLDEALGQSNLPGEQLVLEITESMLVQNLDATDSVLKQLKSRGVCLTIDDFGTGYSSLSYLHRLTADALKIDRSFVSPCVHDDRNQAIASSIVALSNLLELQAIAEGIETLDQLQWLKSLDCELGQGYYFSPPISVDQATELIDQMIG